MSSSPKSCLKKESEQEPFINHQEEEDRLINERRQKRLKILEKYKNLDKNEKEQEILILNKSVNSKENKSASAEAQEELSAADYDPFFDKAVDEEKHKVEKQIKPIDDMFADEMLAEKDPQKHIVEQSALNPSLADNWDDSEGYYQTIIGEKIIDRYHVNAHLGKGLNHLKRGF
jgi:serine/threonine-protein kinase PRP4